MSSQAKAHIPSWKTVTSSLRTFTSLFFYKEKQSENVIKRVKIKTLGFFLMSKGSLNPKIMSFGQKVCSVDSAQVQR